MVKIRRYLEAKGNTTLLCFAIALATRLERVASGQVFLEDESLIDKVRGRPEHVHFFTSSQSVQLFFDGQRTLPDYWMPGKPGWLSLTERPSHVIAVYLSTKQQDSHGHQGKQQRVEVSADSPATPAEGFLLSIQQHIPTRQFSATDDQWRCISARSHPELLSSHGGGGGGGGGGWFKEQYDDSHWPQAAVLGQNGDKPWVAVLDISSHAKWIWAKDSSGMDDVYCRGIISTYPDMLRIASEPPIEVYDNGRHIPSTSSIPINGQTRGFVLPSALTHVIAIRAHFNITDPPANSAFIASLQPTARHGAVTDQSWRCASSLSASESRGSQWAQPQFSDAHWLAARVFAQNGGDLFPVVLDVSREAYWLWAADHQATEVFCRSGKISSSSHDGRLSEKKKDLMLNKHQQESTSGAFFEPLPIEPRNPPITSVIELDMSAEDMTWQTFHRQYLTKGLPFKLKGGVRHWPALQKWTDQYLKDAIGDEEAIAMLAPRNMSVFYFYGEKMNAVQLPFRQFLMNYRRSSRVNNMYVTAYPLADEHGRIIPTLAKDLERPSWSKLMELHGDSNTNLWMGLGPQLTPAHFDNTENLMCVVAGRKRFRLYEPAMSNYLYPVSHNKDYGITSQIANLSNPDLDRFPLAVQLRPVFVDLEAGDLLFIPAYWWHEVVSEGRNVAVNMWFNSHSSLLDSIYLAWYSRLPQTVWGKKMELEGLSRLGDEDEDKGEEEDEGDLLDSKEHQQWHQHNEL